MHYECGSSKASQRTCASGGISSQISEGKVGQWCQKPDQSIGFLSARQVRKRGRKVVSVQCTPAGARLSADGACRTAGNRVPVGSRCGNTIASISGSRRSDFCVSRFSTRTSNTGRKSGIPKIGKRGWGGVIILILGLMNFSSLKRSLDARSRTGFADASPVFRHGAKAR